MTFLSVSEQGFGFLVSGGGHGLQLFCSQTWPGDLLLHFLESHGGPGSLVGPRCTRGGEAAGLSAVGGLVGQGYWRLGTEGLL